MTAVPYAEPPDPLLPSLPADTESSIVLTTGVDAGTTARVRTSELTKAGDARLSALESQVAANTAEIANLGGLYRWHDEQIIDLRKRVEALESARSTGTTP
jgi:predicted ATPase